MSWWNPFAREIGETLVEAKSGPPAQQAPPRRQGFEYGISQQGLSEYNQGTALSGNDRRALMTQLYEAFLACPWSWASVNAIARRVTAGALILEWDPQDGSDVEEPTTKPANVLAFEALLAYCNARENIRQLIRGIVADLLVFGDAFVEVVWIGKQPVALHSLDAPSMFPVADQHGVITGYVQITESYQRAEFEPREVIHISLDAPRSGIFGVSPTYAALLPITSWLFTAATLKEIYRKGNPPNIHVDLPGSADADVWLDQYMARNVGSRNIGRPIVTKNGGQVSELQRNGIPELLEVLAQRRDEIVSAYGVPPAQVGIIESGNLGGGTGESQQKSFELITCDPIASLILEALFFHLGVQGFGIEGWKLGFTEVDLRDSDTVEGIREKRLQNGVWTVNRYRADVGEPTVDGGDDAVLMGAATSNLVRVTDLDASAKAQIAKAVVGTELSIGDPGETGDSVELVKAPKPDPMAGPPGFPGGPDGPGGPGGPAPQTGPQGGGAAKDTRDTDDDPASFGKDDEEEDPEETGAGDTLDESLVDALAAEQVGRYVDTTGALWAWSDVAGTYERALTPELTESLRAVDAAAFLDEHDAVWLWSVEETKYVRTAKGSAHYGLPIGAPIVAGAGTPAKKAGGKIAFASKQKTQKATAAHFFGGGGHGATWNPATSTLDVTDPAAAGAHLDNGLKNHSSTTPVPKVAISAMKKKVAALDDGQAADVDGPSSPAASTGNGPALSPAGTPVNTQPGKLEDFKAIADVDVGEPPMPQLAPGKRMSTGIIVREPDGRIWILEPKGHYGGYEHTFPKGGIEDDGLTPQQNAHKELFEELGLKAKITGYVGDYKGSTGVTRMYVADRTGGTPHPDDPTPYVPGGLEAASIKLVTPGEAEKLLNTKRDKQMLADLQAMTGGAAKTSAIGKLQGQMLAAKDDASKTWELRTKLQEHYLDGSLLPKPEGHTPEQKAEWKAYVAGVSTQVNGYLRKGGQPPNPALDARIATLDASIPHVKTKQSVTVYRGIPASALGDVKVGGTFTDQGFQSTSLDPMMPETWAGSDGKILQIEVPKGTAVGWDPDSMGIPPASYQAEMVLPRGASIEITAVDGNRVTGRLVLTKPQAATQSSPSVPVKTTDWERVGKQKGSNPGGTFVSPSGGRFYVKQSKSEKHARNEVLAANLYKLAGVEHADLQLADVGDGKLGTASEIIDGSKANLGEKLKDPQYKAEAQRGFAVDAWLANWDVAGAGLDNMVTDAHGKPVRIDPGGALLFRAQGTPKGAAFGDSVGEWDSLRSSSVNAQSAKVFAGMTPAQLKSSAKRVVDVTPEQIDKAIADAGFTGSDAKLLSDRLKARRADVAKRAGLELPEGGTSTATPDASPAAPAATVSTPGAGELVTQAEAAEKIGLTSDHPASLLPDLIEDADVSGYPMALTVGHLEKVQTFDDLQDVPVGIPLLVAAPNGTLWYHDSWQGDTPSAAPSQGVSAPSTASPASPGAAATPAAPAAPKAVVGVVAFQSGQNKQKQLAADVFGPGTSNGATWDGGSKLTVTDPQKAAAALDDTLAGGSTAGQKMTVKAVKGKVTALAAASPPAGATSSPATPTPSTPSTGGLTVSAAATQASQAGIPVTDNAVQLFKNAYPGGGYLVPTSTTTGYSTMPLSMAPAEGKPYLQLDSAGTLTFHPATPSTASTSAEPGTTMPSPNSAAAVLGGNVTAAQMDAAVIKANTLGKPVHVSKTAAGSAKFDTVGTPTGEHVTVTPGGKLTYYPAGSSASSAPAVSNVPGPPMSTATKVINTQMADKIGVSTAELAGLRAGALGVKSHYATKGPDGKLVKHTSSDSAKATGLPYVQVDKNGNYSFHGAGMSNSSTQPKGAQHKPAPTPNSSAGWSQFANHEPIPSDTPYVGLPDGETAAQRTARLAAERAAADQYAKDYRKSLKAAGDLTEDEKYAIRAYGASGYQMINGGLRNPPPEEVAQGWIDKIDAAMLKVSNPEPRTVWRGTGGWSPPMGLKPGDTFTDQGFVSTSLASGSAFGGTRLEISLPAGFPVVSINGALTKSGAPHGSELELLLPHGTEFAVVSDEIKGGARWMKVEAIPPAYLLEKMMAA